MMHKYFLTTSSHVILHRGMKPMDVNMILWRLGKSLGAIK